MKKYLDLSLLGYEESPSFEQKNRFFSHCFEVLHAAVFSIAYDFFNNEKDAEDQLIEFFEKLMSWPVSRFRETENLVGYILKAARNHCINELRFRKHRMNNGQQVSMEQAMEIPYRGRSIEKELIINESLEAVKRAIACLPEPQQQVLVMKAQGYSHKEIAAAIGIDESASTSRLNRARRNLREILHEKGLK